MVQRLCDGCRRGKCRLCLVEEGRNKRPQADQARCNGADIYFECSPDEIAVVIETITILEVMPKMIGFDSAAYHSRESHAKSEKQADLGADVELQSRDDRNGNQSQESICEHSENCSMLACAV